ncbi:MAG: carboxymuconolactone decarboxylase family protein [Planctomycetales bacterium]|nr:carboxymuconolactone decarboxylase family protein [Planctomycetales bacterium]
MPRIAPLALQSASAPVANVLETVQKKLGSLPNLIATLAHSPAALRGYLSLSEALAEGTLSPRLREQLSLVVGEANRCDYCVAAHTALGKAAGLTVQETCDARCASSSSPQERAALQFAQRMLSERGQVSDTDIDEVRQAGYGDGEIAEIIGCVALNVFSNYFNHAAQTDVDFAAAPQLIC